jgi:hypothetical protein
MPPPAKGAASCLEATSGRAHRRGRIVTAAALEQVVKTATVPDGRVMAALRWGGRGAAVADVIWVA